MLVANIMYMMKISANFILNNVSALCGMENPQCFAQELFIRAFIPQYRVERLIGNVEKETG